MRRRNGIDLTETDDCPGLGATVRDSPGIKQACNGFFAKRGLDPYEGIYRPFQGANQARAAKAKARKNLTRHPKAK